MTCPNSEYGTHRCIRCDSEVEDHEVTAYPDSDVLARAEEGVRYWTDLAQAEARDAATLRARVAALEAAHTEALDALEDLDDACAAVASWSSDCIDFNDPVRERARAVLAKAGRR